MRHLTRMAAVAVALVWVTATEVDAQPPVPEVVTTGRRPIVLI